MLCEFRAFKWCMVREGKLRKAYSRYHAGVIQYMQPMCPCASLQVVLLLSVAYNRGQDDLVYVRWFQTPIDEWNRNLNLRPLQWQRCATGRVAYHVPVSYTHLRAHET